MKKNLLSEVMKMEQKKMQETHNKLLKQEEQEKQKFIPMQLHLQEGDIITSKKGILNKSPLTNEFFLVKKMEIIGNGYSKVIGDKIEIDVKPIKDCKGV